MVLVVVVVGEPVVALEVGTVFLHSLELEVWHLNLAYDLRLRTCVFNLFSVLAV